MASILGYDRSCASLDAIRLWSVSRQGAPDDKRDADASRDQFKPMKTEIAADPKDRLKVLVAERNRKMAASAHAYVRGSTTRFYEWLEASNRLVLPEGPEVWICGDCHVGNLGPVASASGALAIQISGPGSNRDRQSGS